MAQGGAVREHRPRNETMHWAAAASAGCAVVAVVTHDVAWLCVGALCLALLLQCSQRIVVDGSTAQRFGLRPVVIDLSTAEVVRTGASWWRELFFCSMPLQLRDADGHRLYLESWLWDVQTRLELVKASGEAVAI
jgi:hypothetical protein